MENLTDFVPVNDSVIRGLKSKLKYESCDLLCTPADRCTCEQVLSDIAAANEWITSLAGEAISCEQKEELCDE